MKDNTYIALTMLACLQFASCQEVKEHNYSLSVEVADDAGRPVAGAAIIAGKVERVPGGAPWQGESKRVEGFATDATGSARLDYKSLPFAGEKVSITKEGYYSYYGSALWKPVGKFDSGKWQASIKAVLKPVIKPIPMRVYRGLRMRTPEFGVAYGLDLELGEALPPFGGGKVADIVIKLEGTRNTTAPGGKDALDFAATIQCPEKDDGLVEFLIDDPVEFSKGSTLQSSNLAPAEGYLPTITRAVKITSGGDYARFFEMQREASPKSCYFRVRTKKDSQGNIISAHYGKMYGPLEVRPALQSLGHDVSKGQGGLYINYLYFNPTPNDRNVEFDVKRNLTPNSNVTVP